MAVEQLSESRLPPQGHRNCHVKRRRGLSVARRARASPLAENALLRKRLPVDLSYSARRQSGDLSADNDQLRECNGRSPITSE